MESSYLMRPGSINLLCACAACCLLLAPVAGRAGEAGDKPAAVGVGDVLAIAAPTMVDCPLDSEKVVLLLDGLDSGLKPIGCDPQRKTISFRLQPSDAKAPFDATWSKVLGRPWDAEREGSWPAQRIRPVDVTLTRFKSDGSSPTVLFSGERRLRLISSTWPVAAVFLFGTIAALVYLGRRSGMLRDANSTAEARLRPYSLSRLQMAWWFALVLVAYVMLLVSTMDWPLLSGAVLALLGISGAAGVASAGIDNDPSRAMPPTAGFWRDILTDAKGITLARFQMFVWNVVIGVFFLYEAICNLRIPELDVTTLGLLGLSAGAYVGLKVPETHS